MSEGKEHNLEDKENFEDPDSVLETDALSPLDLDSAAEELGPLSDIALKRDKAVRDMHLLSSGRPIRYLSTHPAGKELKHMTAEDKAFVRKAYDENFTVEFHPSPWIAFNLKKAGTDSYERYSAYSKAQSDRIREAKVWRASLRIKEPVSSVEFDIPQAHRRYVRGRPYSPIQ